jgi:hypothetical protein
LSHGPKWDFAVSKSLFSQWPIIDSNGIERLSERQIAIAPLSLIAVQLLGNPIAVNPSSDASPSISVGNRCRRNSHSRCFATQHRAMCMPPKLSKACRSGGTRRIRQTNDEAHHSVGYLAAGQLAMVGKRFPRLQSDDELSTIFAGIEHCD